MYTIGKAGKDVRTEPIEIIHHDLANDPGRASEREETRRRRADKDYNFYADQMATAGFEQAVYPFREAWEEWAYNHRHKMSFGEFIMKKIQGVKNK